jgi:WD40 repeat protein
LSFLIPKQKWAFKGHESAVKHLLLTPDGKTAVSMGENGYLRIVDVETGQIHYMNHFPMDSHAMDLSSDGTMLAVGTLSVFSLISGATRRIKNREERWDVVRHLIFSPDDKDLLFTDDSRVVYLWRGKEKRVVTFCEGPRGSYSSAPLFFPDGCRLVVCPCHSEMEIYRWETGQKIAEIP